MGAVVTVTDSTQRRAPKAAKTTSVFKKAVMAISGIILVLYLIAHMIGNLKAFSGREAFNNYSEWIRIVGSSDSVHGSVRTIRPRVPCTVTVFSSSTRTPVRTLAVVPSR